MLYIILEIKGISYVHVHVLENKLVSFAFRCWSLKFKPSDHQFLHQSNVFHHINNILSKSDDGDSEESFNISVQSGYEAMNQAGK